MEGYTRKIFAHDLTAGITVGIIALPLAMAFAIGVGVDPEKGLYTAIVGGLLNALFSGSRFLIGGPIGANIILLYGVVQQFGYEGLACATVQAGIFLILFGLLRCGSIIRFIPYPVIVGFSSGVGVCLLTSQCKDFFGLSIPNPPADVIGRVRSALEYGSTLNIPAVLIAVMTLALIICFRRISKKIPGVIIALIIAAVITTVFNLPIETIESKFGVIPRLLPSPHWPAISIDLIRQTFPSAMSIALLGAIESLLAAVIADSLAGTRHKSNCELVAQGLANLGSVAFGGIPSSGAVARTTANLQMQAKTPIAGIIHSITLLVLMFAFAPYASKIPLSALSAVLVSVAWNLFEFSEIKELLKGQLGEALVLLTTLGITIVVDLNAAIQAGILLSVILFVKRSKDATTVRLLEAVEADERMSETHSDASWEVSVPEDTKIYEIEGPFFFAVADILSDVLTHFDPLPKNLILRFRSVPFIDSTAVNALRRFDNECSNKGVTLYIAETSPSVQKSLTELGFFHTFPKERSLESLEFAPVSS